MLLKKVWSSMTDKEKEELTFLTLSGGVIYRNGNEMTVMMGSKAFNNVKEFEQKMNNKYGKN